MSIRTFVWNPSYRRLETPFLGKVKRRGHSVSTTKEEEFGDLLVNVSVRQSRNKSEEEALAMRFKARKFITGGEGTPGASQLPFAGVSRRVPTSPGLADFSVVVCDMRAPRKADHGDFEQRVWAGR